MDKLTIRDIRARPVMVPLRRPLVSASGAIPTAPLVLIDLDTEQGITGRSYLFAFTPGMLKPIVASIEAVRDVLKGDALAPLNLEQKIRKHYTLFDTPGILGLAIAGVDMCAWDALARAQGVPLVRLLGGEMRPVRAYNSCGLWIQPVDKLPDEALGDRVTLMCDFNQRLTVNEAILRGRMIDDEGLFWIEEPVRHDHYAGYAQICAELQTPIQTGENLLNTFELIQAIQAQSLDFVMPDIQRIGGVTGWLRAAAITHAYGIEMSSHLFPEFSAHVLAVTPTCHYLEYMDWAAPLVTEPLRIDKGHAVIPNRPGAGLDWNEEAVRRYQVA
jgi:mandelate racemase